MVRLSDGRSGQAAQQEQLGPMRARATADAWDHEPPSVAADWLDLDVFRALDFRARRAGFVGRPRPMLNATSRRCWA